MMDLAVLYFVMQIIYVDERVKVPKFLWYITTNKLKIRRVTINTYKLSSIVKVYKNQLLAVYTSYIVVFRLLNKYIMINCIKVFLEVNKYFTVKVSFV